MTNFANIYASIISARTIIAVNMFSTLSLVVMGGEIDARTEWPPRYANNIDVINFRLEI